MMVAARARPTSGVPISAVRPTSASICLFCRPGAVAASAVISARSSGETRTGSRRATSPCPEAHRQQACGAAAAPFRHRRISRQVSARPASMASRSAGLGWPRSVAGQLAIVVARDARRSGPAPRARRPPSDHRARLCRRPSVPVARALPAPRWWLCPALPLADDRGFRRSGLSRRHADGRSGPVYGRWTARRRRLRGPWLRLRNGDRRHGVLRVGSGSGEGSTNPDLRIHPKPRLAQFGNDWFQAPDDKLVPLPGLGGIIDRLDPA